MRQTGDALPGLHVLIASARAEPLHVDRKVGFGRRRKPPRPARGPSWDRAVVVVGG